jgi:hypothetical protein
MTERDEALRDAIFLLLNNARHEIDGAVASLQTSDDVGLRHHAKRMADGLRIALQKIKELPQ